MRCLRALTTNHFELLCQKQLIKCMHKDRKLLVFRVIEQIINNKLTFYACAIIKVLTTGLVLQDKTYNLIVKTHLKYSPIIWYIR